MKSAFKLLLLIGVVGYLAFTIIKFAKPTQEGICEGVDIVFLDSVTPGFIDAEYITDILAAKKISPEGQKLENIDMPGLKDLIARNEYIDSALCYYTATHHLCISVIPRKPILHVLADSGKEFYIDQKGKRMDVGKFNLNLPVATGTFEKRDSLHGLVRLVEYLNTDDFWNNEVEQIVYSNPDHIEIIPKTGNHVIIIGEPTNLETKFSHLRLFYSKGLDKIGWNRYESLDVSYNDQLVAKKRQQAKNKK